MEFGIIGTSVWQQNLNLMEQLTLDRATRVEALRELKRALGLDELVYLSTCNRVEFIYVTSRSQSDTKLLHRLLDHFFGGGHDIAFFPNDFYHFTGREAVTHVFRTAASLESLVVGETQITGQLKEASEEATQHGLAGPNLENLIGEALKVARKVRGETSIGVGALSMASLAAIELGSHLRNVAEPTVVLVGAGAMSRKLAAHIRENLAARMIFVNRTVERVENLAEEFGGTVMSLSAFQAYPPTVDAIISATASPEPVFDVTFLNCLATRPQPILCLDLAIPRDFSSDFANASQVTLIDIPTLKSRCQVNLRQKFVEANKADEIAREAVNRYLADRVQVSLKPLFHTSYQESLQLAQQALNDLFTKKLTSLEQEERDAVVRLVTKLIGHSSFQPAKLLSDHIARTQAEFNVLNPPRV